MILISFSKVWGQNDHRWNYPGGDWNFKTMADLMDYYGIKEARITGTDIYFDGEKEITCNEYSGWATKQIERLKKHWHIEYCKMYSFTIPPRQ